MAEPALPPAGPVPAFPSAGSVPPSPPEPTELRHRTRSEAGEDPAGTRDRLAEGDWITGWLWTAWAPELEPAGVGRDQLRHEAGRWSRELWLWVMGERQWAEVCALVYGGLLRRAAVTSGS